MGIHAGAPRATLDTDIAVTSTMARQTVTSAMQHAGFRLVGEFEHSSNFRHSIESLSEKLRIKGGFHLKAAA